MEDKISADEKVIKGHILPPVTKTFFREAFNIFLANMQHRQKVASTSLKLKYLVSAPEIFKVFYIKLSYMISNFIQYISYQVALFLFHCNTLEFVPVL